MKPGIIAGLLALTLSCVALSDSRANASSTETRVLVAAASSLRTVWPALIEVYRANTGDDAASVAVTFGASTTLMRQIREGAPFALFLSADERQVERLTDAGLTVDGGRLYALGTLSLALSPRLAPEVAPTLAGLGDCVTSGLCRRIAIANPNHAPYGVAAADALRARSLWSLTESRLVRGDNAAQALQYVLVGAADIALVPTALLSGSHADARLRTATLSADDHPMVRHRLVRLRGGGDAAARLEAFLLSPSAATVWRRFGFTIPG